MITLPAAVETDLESGAFRPVTAIEITLADDGTVLRYSSQAFTWSSNAYTALVESTSRIVEDMAGRITSASVDFSNVNHTLRSYIAPTDRLTGSTLVIRYLYRVGGGSFRSESLIRFKGIIHRPRMANERTIRLTATTPPRDREKVPARGMGGGCPWIFADGVNCNYTFTTTAANSGSSSTALTLTDEEDKFADGDSITIGSGTAVTISSGGGTTSLTLAEARTWSALDQVKHVVCDREFPNCQKRERTHEFGGFRGRRDLDRELLIASAEGLPQVRNAILRNIRQGDFGLLDQLFPQGVAVTSREDIVPVVFGRRLTPGIPIEEGAKSWGVGQLVGTARMFGLSEGVIGGINNFYTDRVRSAEVTAANFKAWGYYYRDGSTGVDDTETQAEYQADPTTNLRSQNRDYWSSIQDTFSRTAYATLVATGQYFEIFQSGDVLFDVDGVEVQKYLANGSADGSPATSSNPIWQCVAIMENSRWGLGRLGWDVDYSVCKASADTCDEIVNGPVVTASSTATSATVPVTGDLEHVEVGMTMEHSVGPTNRTVVEVTVDSVVFDSSFAFTSGDTFTAKVKRYECNIVLDRQQSAVDWIKEILKTCGGFVTHADGKVQFRVEKAETAAGDYRDTGATDHQGMKFESFEWLIGDPAFDSSENRVIVRYRNFFGDEAEAKDQDWDHIEKFGENPVVIDAPGILYHDQAQRIATIELKKRRSAEEGAELVVEPIGLRQQPGDVTEITHAVANWSQAKKRISRVEVIGQGDNDEYFTAFETRGYAATLYSDDTPPRTTRPVGSAPTITLSIDRSTGGVVVLTWEVTAGEQGVRYWRIFRATSSMSSPTFNDAVGRLDGRSPTRQFVYTPREDEIGQTLYFVVGGVAGRIGIVYSNEVSATPTALDPTDTQFEPGENHVHDGGFTDPDNWGDAGVTETPTDGSGAGTGDWSNGANVWDENDSTYASVTHGGTTRVHEWSGFGTGSDQGRLRFTLEMTSASAKADIAADYSVDGGTNWIFIQSYRGTTIGNNPQTVFGPQLDVSDLSQLKIRFRTNGGVTGWDARALEIDWMSQTASGVLGLVTGDEAVVRGNGTDYGYVERAFPGKRPPSGLIYLRSGESITVQLWVKRLDASTALTDPVEVLLIDDASGDSYTIWTLAGSEIESGYNSWAGLYTATAEITSGLDIRVRTKDAAGAKCDDLQVEPGQQIRYAIAGAQQKALGDYGNRAAVRGGYPRGAWDGSLRKAAVS